MPLGWAFFGTIKSMLAISELLPEMMTREVPAHRTNKFWLIAEKIAAQTGTKPNRWLREVKSHEHACQRALDSLKELSPRNPAAYFQWLLKKYKK